MLFFSSAQILILDPSYHFLCYCIIMLYYVIGSEMSFPIGWLIERLATSPLATGNDDRWNTNYRPLDFYQKNIIAYYPGELHGNNQDQHFSSRDFSQPCFTNYQRVNHSKSHQISWKTTAFPWFSYGFPRLDLNFLTSSPHPHEAWGLAQRHALRGAAARGAPGTLRGAGLPQNHPFIDGLSMK